MTLHLDGWSVKSIASYLKVSRTTVYRVFGRWIEEGDSGLEDRPPGRPRGVRKMDLATMDIIRRAQENPELGAFRIHAALEQKRGAEVSVRTVGTVMAVHRDLYGFGKPKRSSRRKAEMPFEAKRRHEIWTADVRYVPHSIPGVGNAYVIAVLENYSRCVLASAVSLTQDTIAFLRVFYSAVERYGPLERLVTDGGGIFKANQVKAVYRALGIEKEQIERRKPYQSYMRDHVRHPQKDGGLALRKSRDLPRTRGGPRRLEGGLQRAEALGPRKAGGRAAQPARRPRLLHRPPAPPQGGPPPRLLLHPPHACPRCLGVRQVPGLEALRRGGRPPSWQQPDSLTLEYGGQTLSSYDVVELSRETGKPTAVGSARLFGTTYVMRQLRLFALEEAGWHKAMKLEGYAPRRPTGPMALQEVLFPYLDAL